MERTRGEGPLRGEQQRKNRGRIPRLRQGQMKGNSHPRRKQRFRQRRKRTNLAVNGEQKNGPPHVGLMLKRQRGRIRWVSGKSPYRRQPFGRRKTSSGPKEGRMQRPREHVMAYVLKRRGGRTKHFGRDHKTKKGENKGYGKNVGNGQAGG